MKLKGLYRMLQSNGAVFGFFLMAYELKWSLTLSIAYGLIVFSAFSILLDIRGLLWRPKEAREELDR